MISNAPNSSIKIKLAEGLAFNAAAQSVEWMQYSCRSGFHASAISQLIVDFVESRPASAFFDVGAQYGYFSLLVSATARGKSFAYAFEADAGKFAALQANISVNPQLLTIIPLRSNAGEFDLSALPRSHHDRCLRGDQHNVEMVDLGCIDDFCRKRNVSPQLMRIDLGGYEGWALKGMAETINSDCPFFLKLYSDRRLIPYGHTQADVLKWLLDRELQVFDLRGFRRYQRRRMKKVMTWRLRSAIESDEDAPMLVSRHDIREYWPDLLI